MTNKTYLLLLSLLLSISTFSSLASERAHQGWEKIKQGSMLIDVRTPEEYEQGHLDNAQLHPLQDIESWSESIAKDTPIVLYCRSGRRSGAALEQLKQKGFTHVHNAGGYSEMLQSSQ
ncbi:rhodanese-like domain-containing protein [Vibrio genomosp. F10]|uniref:Sulfurtransferase n=2 Tax=Vibrio genomosp. F10 TaxID=723171 RepID=A0A1B9QVQ8_9VIBR|nr:rhodanese-like domain-containing protein [Vibrio genomosp. F10]OCH73253.1 sulfurtransferase [Vibrio genomosp. F10]OEE37375.1 sulfurtransferase [Vibrio genomosp. F10 str. ZF-129]OEE95197.1 sulfurtransferase [Vibrio genomosp. F10 str. 9ZC157]OEF07340.1 sulfurtransferase [Vibrio genomosp. F10 str. 9ZB36]OEF08851.1 sulfurtransferase [Vibrio genomosp. F10 str. 9ZD137]